MEHNAKRARALSNSLALRSVSKKSKKRPKKGNHGSPYISTPEACSRACTGRTMNGITANAFSFCDRREGELDSFFRLSLSLFSGSRTEQKKLSHSLFFPFIFNLIAAL